MNHVELQRALTRVALEALDGTRFALAGSSALREHGITSRPTEDVDLFTSDTSVESFAYAVERVLDALGDAGYAVDVDLDHRSEQFARLHVRSPSGEQLDLDMAMDWRGAESVALSIGEALSLDDAVHNKVSALYGRAAARDYLDVDAIRASGRFSDAELVESAQARDPGFDVSMFAAQLEHAERLRGEMVEEYGVDIDQLDSIKERFAEWARRLRRST